MDRGCELHEIQFLASGLQAIDNNLFSFSQVIFHPVPRTCDRNHSSNGFRICSPKHGSAIVSWVLVANRTLCLSAFDVTVRAENLERVIALRRVLIIPYYGSLC